MHLHSNGDQSLMSRKNYVENLGVLIAELDASKDLNRKVSVDVEKVFSWKHFSSPDNFRALRKTYSRCAFNRVCKRTKSKRLLRINYLVHFGALFALILMPKNLSRSAPLIRVHLRLHSRESAGRNTSVALNACLASSDGT